MSELGYWRFISVTDLLKLHEKVMMNAHQHVSPPARTCAESCVHNAMNAAFYGADNNEPDLLRAVSYLLYYIVKNHCFVDGNKRTAWASCVHVLWSNGLAVNVTQTEAARFVNQIAASTKRIQDIIGEIHSWTKDRLIVLSPN